MFISELNAFTTIGTKKLDQKLSQTVGNMMNEILFGVNYSEDDEIWNKIQKLREDGIKEIEVATPVNFLPWLRHLIPRFNHTLNWMIEVCSTCTMYYVLYWN